MSDGNSKPVTQSNNNVAGGVLTMDVLMGIDVSWRLSDDFDELRVLPFNLGCDGGGICDINNMVALPPLHVLVNPFTQIDMEADAQGGMMMNAVGRFGGGGAAHHEAGAGYNALGMSGEDAFVCTGACTEVVGIDHQFSHAAMVTPE